MYERLVRRLAAYRGDIAPYLEYIINNHKYDAIPAIEERSHCLTSEEEERAGAYESLGFFKELEGSMRMAAYNIVFDAEYERELRRQVKSCTPYHGDEPIFGDRQIKEQCDGDLINRPIGERLPNSNIFRKGSKWGYYDRRIPLEFYDWLEQCFANKPSRIRVEPGGLYDHKPKSLVLECMVVPPKWKWWKNLTIYTGTFSGSEFILLGNDVHNLADYQDYHYHHVRKLQVVVKRRDADYLSMMVEELSEFNHPTDSRKKYVLGRMIHLDSSAKYGIPFEEAKLTHIDLAYNLYIDADADIRINQSLAMGKKVQDASYRTHVLRVEDVPFNTLFKFAIAFFKSKYLTEEWISTEFR